MKIPFVGAAYTARSLNADAQRAVNVYLETDQTSQRAPFALYGRPGMVLETTIGSGPHRGAIVMGTTAYVVSGDEVYKVDSALSATLLGTIGTSSGPVGIAQDGQDVLIVDGVAGWLANTTLTQIADPDFPNGVTQAVCIDGYFIVAGDGTQTIYCDETPRGGASWSGLDFASAEGAPDNTIALATKQRELWPLGSLSAEVWTNTGNPDFPFERLSNVFVEAGIQAAFSLAKIDQSLFWLGRDENGAGIVFKTDGYVPRRISTHPIEREIAGYTTSDAQGFCFQMEGHSFYVLSFPSSDATWVYDVATDQWFQWAWRDPLTGDLHRWRAATHLYFAGKQLVGDWETGKLYSLSLDTYTDNGDPMLCLRASQTGNAEGKRMFFRATQVDMEAGVGGLSGGTMMLRYSNDGGHTWSNPKERPIGSSGQYGTRVKFGPTGAGRDRVWEISRTDDFKFAVLGAFAEVEA